MDMYGKADTTNPILIVNDLTGSLANTVLELLLNINNTSSPLLINVALKYVLMAFKVENYYSFTEYIKFIND